MRVEELFALVLPEVMSCPTPVMQQHIALAAQRLCIEAGVWQVLTEPQTTQAGVNEYEIDQPTMTGYALRVRDAWLDGQLLPPSAATAAHGYTHLAERNVLRLNQAPRTGQLLQMRLVMAPKHTDTVLDDQYALRYMSAIASGAKATLMLLPSQPWINPALAQYHGSVFQSAIADARIDATRDWVDNTLTVRRKPFA